MGTRIPLAEPYESFLQSKKKDWSHKTFMSIHNKIKAFAIWVDKENIDLYNFSIAEVRKYSEYLKTKYCDKPNSRVCLMGCLRLFIVHYAETKIIKSKLLDIYPNFKFSENLDFEVPKWTHQYYDLIEARCSLSSLKRYQVDIRRFHLFLKKYKINLKKLNRKNMELFFKYLLQRKIYPSTRRRGLTTIKCYLNWLWENNRIDKHPDLLVSIKDIPKVPKMLPKPLPLLIDSKIQDFCTKSDDIFHKGFLLMRITGIRVGELINLKFNCIEKDLNKNSFLKVPLGKLKTERLVPLSDDGIKLINSIQKQSASFETQNKTPHYDRLILRPTGMPSTYSNFRTRMADIQSDHLGEQIIQVHKLRHTCASELVNSGMNLFALKEFLGHKDIHMTLKYTSLNPTTVRDEYHKSIRRLSEKLESNKKVGAPNQENMRNLPANQLEGLIADLTKRTDSNTRKVYNLIRKLRRLKDDLKQI